MLTALLTLAAAGPALAQARYEVEPGDTLSLIADRTAADSWRELYRANPSIDNPDVIHPGDMLLVPSGSTSGASADRGDSAASGDNGRNGATSSPENNTDTDSDNDASRQSSGSVSGVWAELAACESNGQWDLDGQYNGGLQFAPGTWRAFGGEQYAPSADEATPAQQIAIAKQVQAAQGWHAWPACADALGLG